MKFIKKFTFTFIPIILIASGIYIYYSVILKKQAKVIIVNYSDSATKYVANEKNPIRYGINAIGEFSSFNWINDSEIIAFVPKSQAMKVYNLDTATDKLYNNIFPISENALSPDKTLLLCNKTISNKLTAIPDNNIYILNLSTNETIKPNIKEDFIVSHASWIDNNDILFYSNIGNRWTIVDIRNNAIASGTLPQGISKTNNFVGSIIKLDNKTLKGNIFIQEFNKLESRLLSINLSNNEITPITQYQKETNFLIDNDVILLSSVNKNNKFIIQRLDSNGIVIKSYTLDKVTILANAKISPDKTKLIFSIQENNTTNRLQLLNLSNGNIDDIMNYAIDNQSALPYYSWNSLGTTILFSCGEFKSYTITINN